MKGKISIFCFFAGLFALTAPYKAHAAFTLPALPNIGSSLESVAASINLVGLHPENSLPAASHKGTAVIEPYVPDHQSRLVLSINADPALIKEPRGLSVSVEQIPEDGESWIFGTTDVPDVKAALTTPDKYGKLLDGITLTLDEQIMRADIIKGRWKTNRKILTENDTYYQMAIDRVRITIRSYDPRTGEDADLTYSAVVSTQDKAPAGLPIGHHSASLLGTFAGAHTTSALTAVSGARTTTAGSFIVGFGGSWDSLAGNNNTITDATTACPGSGPVPPTCNTYTEAIDLSFGGGASNPRQIIAYNIGGARGAGHIVKNTKDGGNTTNSISVGAAEFTGVSTSPTVVTNSATGTSGTISVGATAGASSLYVALGSYDTNNVSTITESTTGGWALLWEEDEANVSQDFNAIYNTGKTGLQTATWTVNGTALWGAIIATFTESAAPANSPQIKIRGKVTVRGVVRFR